MKNTIMRKTVTLLAGAMAVILATVATTGCTAGSSCAGASMKAEGGTITAVSSGGTTAEAETETASGKAASATKSSAEKGDTARSTEQETAASGKTGKSSEEPVSSSGFPSSSGSDVSDTGDSGSGNTGNDWGSDGNNDGYYSGDSSGNDSQSWNETEPATKAAEKQTEKATEKQTEKETECNHKFKALYETVTTQVYHEEVTHEEPKYEYWPIYAHNTYLVCGGPDAECAAGWIYTEEVYVDGAVQKIYYDAAGQYSAHNSNEHMYNCWYEKRLGDILYYEIIDEGYKTVVDQEAYYEDVTEQVATGWYRCTKCGYETQYPGDYDVAE